MCPLVIVVTPQSSRLTLRQHRGAALCVVPFCTFLSR